MFFVYIAIAWFLSTQIGLWAFLAWLAMLWMHGLLWPETPTGKASIIVVWIVNILLIVFCLFGIFGGMSND